MEKCESRIMKESDLISTILHGYKWSRTLFDKARVRDVAVAETEERLNELDIKTFVWKSFQNWEAEGKSVRMRRHLEASIVKASRLWAWLKGTSEGSRMEFLWPYWACLMVAGLNGDAKGGERCEFEINVLLIRREEEGTKLMFAESIT